MPFVPEVRNGDQGASLSPWKSEHPGRELVAALVVRMVCRLEELTSLYLL